MSPEHIKGDVAKLFAFLVGKAVGIVDVDFGAFCGTY
jgi:hypothetical protein